MLTKTKFYDEYRTALVAEYPWAKDEEKLNRYMATVRETLEKGANTWGANNAPIVKKVYHAMGGRGVTTLKKLREMPE